jgi:hypothetical protein
MALDERSRRFYAELAAAEDWLAFTRWLEARLRMDQHEVRALLDDMAQEGHPVHGDPHNHEVPARTD